MPVQQPTQSLEGLSVRGAGFAPLFLSNFVNGVVERLDNMEPVEDQTSIGAMSRDLAHVRFAHVAAPGVDL